MSSRKQTLSLFGFLLRSMLILRSAYPPSYLLPHISEKYEISNTNMKFFSNSGQFSRLHPASHRPLCSVFHQMRQQLPQIRCFTKSTAWFSSRFFPKNRKNHSRANQMMDPWPQMLTCDPDAGQWERISSQGWDINTRFRVTDAESQTLDRTLVVISQTVGYLLPTDTKCYCWHLNPF